MLKNPRFVAVTGLAVLSILVLALLAVAPWSTSSKAGGLVQGDANCDQTVDARDALADLREVADLEPPAPCVFLAGDVDCSGEIEVADTVRILEFAAGSENGVVAATLCPAIGATISPSLTPTASPSASASRSPSPSAMPTPTPTSTPEGSPSIGPSATPSPTATATARPTPEAGAYYASTVLSSTWLGAASNSAIEFAPIPGRPNEALIALQHGLIYRVALNQSFEPVVWGDLTGLLQDATGSEEGLLSLAFSPDFLTDGRVYIYYTEGSPNPSRLVRYHATADDLEENTQEHLIEIEQPYDNHNGGHIVFGTDGDLYIGFGDGGLGGDPGHRSQRLSTLLGKMIRIDVSGQSGYTVPADNPFTGQPCTTPRTNGDSTPCSEIYALGFRNPFRFTSDPVSGDIWVGDVGQNNWEEVDHLAKGGNFGWACYEGLVQYDFDQPENHCAGKSFVEPRAVYGHGSGQAVTGGAIYRGSSMPELYGWYIYADFYTGRIWALNPNDSSDPIEIANVSFNISSFTLAVDGEVYLVSYGKGIYKLTR